MQRIILPTFMIFTWSLIIIACNSNQNGEKQIAGTDTTANQKSDGDTLQNISLCGSSGSAQIPWSVDLPLAQTIPGYRDRTTLINFLQNKFDIFSWKTFIALNWPADTNGDPDTSACFTEDAKSTVWLHWMPSTHIFVPPGSSPSPWRSGSHKGTDYLGADITSQPKPGTIHHPLNSGMHSTFRSSKVDSLFTIHNAEQYPVIDKNHMYTLYENFYNREAYDYIVKSKLYSRQGQREFSKNWPSYTRGFAVTIGKDTMNIEKQFKRAYFPVGNYKDSSKHLGDTTFIFTKNEGAIILKSAWIVLTENDHAAYLTRTVRIKEKHGLKVRTLGLVALHIIHKIAETTQWAWSSFEHIKNGPQLNNKNQAVLEPGVDYLYFDEKNNDTSLYNRRPDSMYQQNPFSRKPSQVVLVQARLQSTDKINQQFHNLIARNNKNSIWLNYRLVGTQWPFNPVLFQFGSDYQPALLANALMETYIQKESSCMGCHRDARFLYDPNAKTAAGYGFNADFVWGLSEAK